MIILRNVIVKAFDTDGPACAPFLCIDIQKLVTTQSFTVFSLRISHSLQYFLNAVINTSIAYIISKNVIVKAVNIDGSVCLFYSFLLLEHCVVKAAESVMSRSIALADLLRYTTPAKRFRNNRPITAPFNNRRTLKFKAQPTNTVFVTVNQMFGGSSQLPSFCRGRGNRIKSLSTVQSEAGRSREAAEHLIDGSENVFVGCALNFRVRMLLKGAVKYDFLCVSFLFSRRSISFFAGGKL